MEQWINLMNMEEKDEELVVHTLEDGASEYGSRAQPDDADERRCFQDQLRSITLINMIFQRKLSIEPYCLAVQPTVRQKSNLSTWQLFKIFLQQLHPLFSIFYRFDISLSRVDRVLFLLTRIVLSALVCLVGVGALRLKTFSMFEEDGEGQIRQAPTDEKQYIEFTFAEVFQDDGEGEA